MEKLITFAVPNCIPFHNCPEVKVWEQRERRDEHSIGFISVLGLNIEASGINTTICTGTGSAKKQLESGVTQEPFAELVYISIIVQSVLLALSHFLIPNRLSTHKQLEQPLWLLLWIKDKTERKSGFRVTTLSRSHLPVNFTRQNLVEQVHWQPCRCVSGSYRLNRAFENRTYYFVSAL